MKYRVLYETDLNGKQRQILIPYEGDETEALELDYSNASVIPNMMEVTGATETIVESMQQSGANLEEVITYTSSSDIPQDSIVEQNGEADQTQEGETEMTESSGLEKDVDNRSLHREAVQNTNQSENNQPVANEIVITDATVSSGIDFVTKPDFSKQEYYNWLTKFTEVCKVVPMPLESSLFQKISQVHKTVSDVMATPSGVVADKENFIVLMNITKELSSIINEHLIYVMQNLGKTQEIRDTHLPENL